MIVALYVQTDGCYANLTGVDCWPEERDARLCEGPWPGVSHTPCQRWGRYAESHPIKGRFAEVGADDSCFAHSLRYVRKNGGVIEHTKDSKAFCGHIKSFNLGRPLARGWARSDDGIGWIAQVEQGHYGHFSRKPTWLYAVMLDDQPPPELIWGPSPQRIHPRALELHGYEKARRIGWMAMIGGKDKTRTREATPPEFRDVLLSIARRSLGVTATDRP